MDTEKNVGFGADIDNEKIDDQDDDIEIIADNSSESIQSDNQNDDKSDSYSEQDNEEIPKKRKIKDPQKTKMNQILRERYQLENERNIIAQENERLRQEMESLKTINSFSTQAAVTNYETSTIDRLQRAKDMKAQAMEAGDIKEQIEADIALNAALAEQERLNVWKENQRLHQQQQQIDYEAYNQQQQSQQYAYNQNQSNPIPNDQIADQWYNENDWFNEKSNNYDPDSKEFAITLADRMDTELFRNGRADAIYSPEYFEYLDMEIDKFKSGHYNDRRRPSSQQRNQSMSTPRSIVSPVSNSGYRTASNVNNRKQVRLTPEQMDMAERMGNIPGVSQSDYARAVIADRERDHNRDTGRR